MYRLIYSHPPTPVLAQAQGIAIGNWNIRRQPHAGTMVARVPLHYPPSE